MRSLHHYVTTRAEPPRYREILSDNGSDLDAYRRSFEKYHSGGPNLQIFLVFNKETYDRGQNQNDPISDPPPPGEFPPANATNAYIEAFAAEMKKLIPEFRQGNLVSDFIIWNEPNSFAAAKRMEPYTFGAMLHRVWEECAMDQPNPPNLLPAGIETVIGHPGSAANYLRDAIRYVRFRMDSGGHTGWPWKGLNFHVHQLRNQTQFELEMKSVNDLRNNEDQNGELLIGEWGVNVTASATLAGLYQQLVGVTDSKPTKMFYFSHQRFFEKDEHDNDVEWGCRIAEVEEVTGRHEYVEGDKTALYDIVQSSL